jgi:Tfp pilus assembly protein PilV
MTPRGSARSRGSTLLEVALAVTLLATSGMGLVATQLWLSRQGQSSAVRGQAEFIADAFAEMAVEGAAGVSAGGQWKARTPLLIDGGSVSTDAAAGAVSSSTVSWPAKSSGPVPQDAVGSPSPCAGSQGASRSECVSLAFAQ